MKNSYFLSVIFILLSINPIKTSLYYSQIGRSKNKVAPSSSSSSYSYNANPSYRSSSQRQISRKKRVPKKKFYTPTTKDRMMSFFGSESKSEKKRTAEYRRVSNMIEDMAFVVDSSSRKTRNTPLSDEDLADIIRQTMSRIEDIITENPKLTKEDQLTLLENLNSTTEYLIGLYFSSESVIEVEGSGLEETLSIIRAKSSSSLKKEIGDDDNLDSTAEDSTSSSDISSQKTSSGQKYSSPHGSNKSLTGSKTAKITPVMSDFPNEHKDNLIYCDFENEDSILEVVPADKMRMKPV